MHINVYLILLLYLKDFDLMGKLKCISTHKQYSSHKIRKYYRKECLVLFFSSY